MSPILARVFVALVALAATLGPTSTARPARALRPQACEAGPNRTGDPVAPPSRDRGGCRAEPVLTHRGPTDRKPVGLPVPAPGYWLGADTTSIRTDGVYGLLNVADPHVKKPDATGHDFVVHRIIAKSCTADAPTWTEIGWGEVEWRDDRQYEPPRVR